MSREFSQRTSDAIVTGATVTNEDFTLPIASSSQPVIASISVVPGELGKGGIFEVIIRVKIAAGHHIYANNTNGSPFKPVSLHVTLPDSIESSGTWIAPPPERTKTGELVYRDSISFHRSFRVRSNIAAGPRSIECDLGYQACTQELCWPFRTIKLVSSINISSQIK